MKIIFVVFLSLSFVFSIAAQTAGARIGTVADLKGKTRVFIIAPFSDVINVIQKILKKDKSFEFVSDKSQADFVFDFHEIEDVVSQRRLSTSFGIGFDSTFPSQIGEATVYYYDKDNTKTIVWSESRTFHLGPGAILSRSNHVKLAKKFFKDFENK